MDRGSRDRRSEPLREPDNVVRLNDAERELERLRRLIAVRRDLTQLEEQGREHRRVEERHLQQMRFAAERQREWLKDQAVRRALRITIFLGAVVVLLTLMFAAANSIGERIDVIELGEALGNVLPG